MSQGTTIPIYAPRLHKSNAVELKDDAEDTIQSVTHQLIAMAATSVESVEGVPWYEHVAREIPSILEEYWSAQFIRHLADRVIDDPDECKDDLEEAP